MVSKKYGVFDEQLMQVIEYSTKAAANKGASKLRNKFGATFGPSGLRRARFNVGKLYSWLIISVNTRKKMLISTIN